MVVTQIQKDRVPFSEYSKFNLVTPPFTMRYGLEVVDDIYLELLVRKVASDVVRRTTGLANV